MRFVWTARAQYLCERLLQVVADSTIFTLSSSANRSSTEAHASNMRLTTLEPHARSGWAYWNDVAVLPSILVALVLFTSILFHDETMWSRTGQAWECFPDGSIDYPWNLYSDTRTPTTIWTASQFLDITLGIGHFNFALAKAIDVMWDLAVGRGGQILVIYGTYQFLRRALLHSMEQMTIPISVFAAMAFDRISLQTLSTMTPTVVSQGRKSLGRRTWFSFRWRYFLICLAVAYVPLFPTLLSVMTGAPQSYEHISNIRTRDFNVIHRLSSPCGCIRLGSQ